MRRTIAELYDLFNDLERRIHFLIRKLKQYSGNQKPVSLSPKFIRQPKRTRSRCCYGNGTEFKKAATCGMAGSGLRQIDGQDTPSWCPRCRQGCHE
jgi:hypothetical protein